MKIIFSFALAFVLSLLCFPQIPLSSQDLNAPSNAFTYNDTSFSKIDEIYFGDGTFSKPNFEKLLQQTSGMSSINASNIYILSSLIESKYITAKDMQGFTTGGKTAGQDIVVRMGGLDWTPTYLSQTKTGDLILTLWLSNNEQEAFQSRRNNAEGDYYGFLRGEKTKMFGLYSDWSADWETTTTSQGTAAFYPSNMYGTSYIRSVTLNNGGRYAISNTELAKDPGQNPYSVFAPFTIASNPLSSFIATPLEVSWQEKQSALAVKATPLSYDSPNDEYNPSTAKGTYYSDDYNYVEHNGYAAWQNDKLWLPSIAETGYRDSNPGIWYTSIEQRSNYDVSSAAFTAQIGTSENKNYNTTIYTSSWLRSGGTSGAGSAIPLLIDGSGLFPIGRISCAQAVRPALHLNITKAAKVVREPTFVDLIPTDSSDPDLYKESGESEGEVIFHIKSEKGLIMMSDYSENDGVWNENWTFLLDNDVDLSDVSCSLGSNSSPFTGTFDGQGFTLQNINPSTSSSSLFNYITEATIKNLKIGTLGSKFSFIGNARGYNRILNININGNANCIIDKIASSVYTTLIYGLNVNGSCATVINSCSGRLEIYSSMFLGNNQTIIGSMGGGNIILNQVYFEDCECLFSYVGDMATLSFIECEIYCAGRSGGEDCDDPIINVFDCVIRGDLFTYFPFTYLCMQGVYDENFDVLDPNFTPSKWFMKGDEPHLRCFYWAGQVAG